jgi:hypothetical protein
VLKQLPRPRLSLFDHIIAECLLHYLSEVPNIYFQPSRYLIKPNLKNTCMQETKELTRAWLFDEQQEQEWK